MITPSDPALRGLARLAERYHRWIIRRSGDVRAKPVNRDLRLRVAKVRREAEDVVSLRLTNGSPLPAWRPGAHLDLHLSSGLRRQYSLCGDPADRFSYRIAVRRIGAGSAEVHSLAEGDEVIVRGPRNAFPYAPANRSLFIAGGIGITPILPMVRAATGNWRLIYCGRSRESLPFLDEIARLDPARVRIRTDDVDGVPDVTDLLGGFDGSVYLCGPAPMLDGIRRTHQGPLHFERFAPPPVVDGRPFEVELSRSGDVLPVPADASALSVIQARLPGVSYSCRQGFCGTCRVRVLGGEVEHRGGATFGHTEDSMLICVSRGCGRIRLDL
ncbi:PDR/VanB family oxidoreductase [Amycolatopsis sp.]|uniref:PDR/VanB family oxidoreductase n=1 Tax=Amycolatopsis sp. TaxID=37632 RepID=UPI002D058400|nr:PDR/VanB family oxidoreductase [Amycolatopsis sp.]HVV11727.1 PDR/VanB family oxidoreductase [Amycolatopsis sp.]